MFVMKACPRCRGDLSLGLDNEITCLQCGYELKPAERGELLARLRWAERRRAAATVPRATAA